MKQQLFAFLLVLFTLISCGDKPLDPSKPVYVTVKTTMGDVTVLLYADTPLHRDNFIRLCQSGEYEGMLFHRIIKDFVVQGGDPTSQAHEPGVLYGDGDGGYTLSLIHIYFGNGWQSFRYLADYDTDTFQLFF